MPLSPKDAFDDSMGRAKYFLDLHEALRCLQTRALDGSWEVTVRTLMNWTKKAKVHGFESPDALLTLRDGGNWDPAYLADSALDELLRAAIVSGVSAFDRLIHDTILEHVLGLLRRPKSKRPSRLQKYRIPLASAEAAIEWIIEARRRDPSKASRPRTKLKEELREALHGDTFQGSGDVEKAIRLLDITGPWSKASPFMGQKADDIKKRLDRVVRRRNQIAHEGDIRREPRPRKVRLNEIDSAKVRADLDWLDKLGTAMVSMVANHI